MKAVKDFFKKHWLVFALLILLILIILIIIVSWLIYPFVACKLASYHGIENLGQFGDIYGGFNALISALVLLLISVTSFLQMRQLNLQREQFEHQHLESNFFNLLNLMDNNIANLSSYHSQKERRRFDGERALEEYLENIELKLGVTTNPPKPQIREDFKRECNSFFESKGDLAKIFQTLFKLIHLIEKESHDKKRTSEYIGILRSQLSPTFCKLLFYYGVITELNGKSEVKQKIESYSLLENVGDESIKQVVSGLNF